MNIKKLVYHLLAVVFISMTTHAYAAGYGDDRALIEDLQARYLFAFDFGDATPIPSHRTGSLILARVKSRAAKPSPGSLKRAASVPWQPAPIPRQGSAPELAGTSSAI